MVTSMTAFSRQSSQNEWGILVWELRSVNHRFLDLSIRLPESLRALETVVRERLGENINRGKVEAVLRHTIGAQPHIQLNFNDKMAQQLAIAASSARQYFPEAQTDLLAILAWPGILETTEILQPDTMKSAALELLQQSIDDLVLMRQREGSKIQVFIEERLATIMTIVADISLQIPTLLASERERMANRMAEFNDIEMNSQRLEQEMTILIQKTDVAEEIQRLRSHCEAMTETLSQRGPVGRRLDFLSQELNREANTLSSKALSVSLTHASVEMKVLIEQIREQVQNIE